MFLEHDFILIKQGPQGPQKLSSLKSLKIQNLPPILVFILLLKQTDIASLSISKVAKPKDRPNLSTNNGDMAEKANVR